MIQESSCIGCQACVEFCSRKALSFHYNEWGEGRVIVDSDKCNNCGLCELHCPSKVNKFNIASRNVYAAISRKNHSVGSSGGVFYELASQFIKEGGVVFGASFDTTLKLKHSKATDLSELIKLCKSKYLHSDMSGIYTEISNCLKSGLKVMFVGTPCQVSAVKNIFLEKYNKQLVLVDFLCHGTGTQKIFDICIKNEEKKRNGKIINFSFKAKSRNIGHSFKYELLREGKKKLVKGYNFEFPYYNSYLKYNIFNEYCYKCKYTRNERVGDITLGDFWGIQKYNRKLKDWKGVSMISVNTPNGKELFDKIKSCCRVYEYQIEKASANNQAFKENVTSTCYNSKLELENILKTKGEEALLEKMRCKNVRKMILHSCIPMFIKEIWHKVRGR